MAASGDPTSVLVQWLRLAPGERNGLDGIPSEMKSLLDDFMTKANDNNLVGARLAARLGLEFVHPIDEHSANDAGEDMPADLVKATYGEIAAADAKSGRNYSKAYRAKVAPVQA